ncbi:FkbM family methyltransferase [Streptomyces sp. NPDC003758]|uniref:FkbM family methyltransferase n=1 Tax=Streptomyces cynarae TaxID=2981134 RepID=A0ABY6E2Y6_9ACTN|nr:FkbM family methyltransferase [Streptomyces cynarae]UXY21005.1 FkbM family methyltransferase [Streptomyces cynarae]
MALHKTILRRARKSIRRLGVDLVRYPQESLNSCVVRLLEAHRVDLVLDVGANSGQYASMLRRLGYQGRMVSFEPLQEPFRRLRQTAANDPLWTVISCAVGDTSMSVTVNVAGNSGASSSVLPMLPRHVKAAPHSRYVGREEVQQHRLDEMWSEFVRTGDRVFLKMDVQGYERNVLRGAGERLDDCTGLQLEASLVPLYDGGMLYREALDLVEKHDFSLMSVLPGFHNPGTGQMYQCDLVCFRE